MTIRFRFALLIAGSIIGLSSILALLYLSLSQLETFNRLETSLADSRAQLLMLKEQEQAFIYNNEKTAAQTLITRSEQLDRQLHQIKSDFAAEDLSLNLLEQSIIANRAHKSAFITLVQQKTLLGLTPTSGMYGQLRDAVHRIESRLNDINNVPLTASMLMLRRHEKDFMLRGQNKYVDKFQAQVVQFQQQLRQQLTQKALPETLLSKTLPETLKASLFNDLDQYQKSFLSFVSTSKTVGLDQQNGAIGQLNLASEQAAQKLAETLAFSHTEISQRVSSHKANSLLLAFIFLILLTASLYWLSHRVVSRISRLVQHLNEIANGDSNLSVRLHSQSQDELGQMANAFNRFVSKIAISMNETITAASQLDHNAAELKQSAESTFQVASRQQALLLQLNDSLEQTGASSGRVQQHIENSQHMMQAVSDKTEAINQLAQDNREATQDLIDEVTATAAHIEQLNHDSQTINDVMGSINEIAAQTNLLALNAAIEAARAGEQGRGFAVVADEVRALASKTQESTEQIQSQVTNLQSNTKEAADSIQATQTATSAQLRQSAEISNVFVVIQHDILSLKQQNNEVENLSHQQIAKIETAEQHLREMIVQVEQNLAAAEQTLSASDELFVLSRSLQTTMGQFAG